MGQRERPRIALVSVGSGNRYGHPSPVTLRALVGTGALVLRTDLVGDAAIVATSTPLFAPQSKPAQAVKAADRVARIGKSRRNAAQSTAAGAWVARSCMSSRKNGKSNVI